MRQHRIVVAAVAVVGLLAVAGCGSSTDNTTPAQSGSSAGFAYITDCAATQSSAAANASAAPISDPTSRASDYTIAPGTLTTCSDVPYPPFEEFADNTPLGFTGFDVDLTQEIALRLGLTLHVIDSDFDALQSGLVMEAGQCDMAASAVTITAERQKNLDFSDPYYDSLQSLLVKKDSGLTDLNQLGGKTIGVQTGTTGKSYAEKNAPKDATLLDLPSDGDLWPAIQAGQVDAILQDCPVNMNHAKADSAYGVVQKWETDEQYGFPFAKGKHTQLRADVNAALAAMRADGTYTTIYHKYFD